MSNKLTKFTPTVCREVSDQIVDELAGLAERLGVEVSAGSGTYSGNNYTVKVTVAIVGDDGVAMTPERQAFLALAHYSGLDADDLDKSFTHNGTQYKIVGWATRSRKYPVLVEDQGGRRVKFTPESVRLRLAAESLVGANG